MAIPAGKCEDGAGEGSRATEGCHKGRGSRGSPTVR